MKTSETSWAPPVGVKVAWHAIGAPNKDVFYWNIWCFQTAVRGTGVRAARVITAADSDNECPTLSGGAGALEPLWVEVETSAGDIYFWDAKNDVSVAALPPMAHTRSENILVRMSSSSLRFESSGTSKISGGNVSESSRTSLGPGGISQFLSLYVFLVP